MKKLLSVLVICLLVFASACAADETALWANAIYAEDTTIGEGARQIKVEVKAGDKMITVTVNTDCEYLAAALTEHDFIEGYDSQYGLYVTAVNGIVADYDKDYHYWAIYQNGEMCLTGADKVAINNGDIISFVYTK
ncbi:MAG: DUF4430 domain-containing protein [Lachnospiraceae bacterium]|nr:DUF4430 domain-containing protein [Candidatus Minthocola equi]